MGYRVRNADGEIQFSDFADLEKAYRAKLVDPEDEVKGESDADWTRAGQIRLLKGLRPESRFPGEASRWYLRGFWLCIAVGALSWIARRIARSYGWSPWIALLPLVLMVLVLGYTQTTARAFRRKGTRPFGR
jgi:hypothetical protein